MKNYFNLSLIIILFFASIIIGCKKNDVTTPLETKLTTEKFVNNYADDGIMVLGKTLENPSTIDVMEKAYQKIVKNGSAKISTEKSPVRVTHLYVQYRPKN